MRRAPLDSNDRSGRRFHALAAQTTDSTQASHGSYLFTLDQCLQYAFGNSYERQSLKLTEKSSDESINQANSNRQPSVNASAGENATHTGGDDNVVFNGNAGINASVNLYEGGSIKNTIAQTKLQKGKCRTENRTIR